MAMATVTLFITSPKSNILFFYRIDKTPNFSAFYVYLKSIINYIIFILIFSFFASGCSQNTEQSDRNNSVYARVDTLCFERYSGAKNQDTASISLIINGDQVNGNYSNYPFEKDARRRIIKGYKAGNDTTVTWYL